MKQNDLNYMKLALVQAKNAFKLSEVPVGSIIVKEEAILSYGFNQTEDKLKVTAHAEILAINNANEKLSNWRLNDCELYVTLEPCMMCLGAILNSRIKRVVFGAREPRFGAVFSNQFINTTNSIYKDLEIVEGVMADECSELIKEFFRIKRKK